MYFYIFLKLPLSSDPYIEAYSERRNIQQRYILTSNAKSNPDPYSFVRTLRVHEDTRAATISIASASTSHSGGRKCSAIPHVPHHNSVPATTAAAALLFHPSASTTLSSFSHLRRCTRYSCDLPPPGVPSGPGEPGLKPKFKIMLILLRIGSEEYRLGHVESRVSIMSSKICWLRSVWVLLVSSFRAIARCPSTGFRETEGKRTANGCPVAV